MRVAIVIAIVSACSDSPTALPPLTVTWTPCQLATSAAEPAECASVAVPYTWDDPSGQQIEVFVKRYHTGTSHGQLWLLQGGPGGSARAFDGAAEYFAKLGVGMDYYILDQRGTGLSTRLGCPDQEAASTPSGYAISDDEWPACLDAMKRAYEPTLAGFTVTNTARDLGELISATRAPDEAAIVYAVSYGPYMANRYLQLYPDQPTAVVLDSICGPGECSFSRADARFDDVGHAYLDACGADPFCASRLGADPWATLASVYDALEAGHCPAATGAGLTRTTLRHAFAQLLYHWDQRALIPALVARLERCDDQDVPVLQYFGQLVNAPETAADLENFSTALFFQIGLSDLWDEPSPSVAEFQAAEAHQLIANEVGVPLATLHDAWPRTPHDAYYGKWATTDVPMLMLGGSLDPATPLAFEQGAMSAFAGPHQTFVAVPNAGHSVITESPSSTGLWCGMTMMLEFIADPTAAVDTSCIATVLPLTFQSTTVSMAFLGTADLWGQ